MYFNKIKVLLPQALVILADFGFPVNALSAFGFIAPKTLIIWLSNLSILSVPDKRVFQMYIFTLFLILK